MYVVVGYRYYSKQVIVPTLEHDWSLMDSNVGYCWYQLDMGEGGGLFLHFDLCCSMGVWRELTGML